MHIDFKWMTEASAEVYRQYIKLIDFVQSSESSATLRGHEPGKSRSFLSVFALRDMTTQTQSHSYYL